MLHERDVPCVTDCVGPLGIDGGGHLTLAAAAPGTPRFNNNNNTRAFTIAIAIAMEVYLQNLPSHLTDQGLKDQLSRFTKTLSIQDWSCQKPRKRPFGFLTFLHPRDGERFLKQYQPGTRQSASLLVLSGQRIQCKRSKKIPDEFLLKSMIKTAEDRLKAQQ